MIRRIPLSPGIIIGSQGGMNPTGGSADCLISHGPSCRVMHEFRERVQTRERESIPAAHDVLLQCVVVSRSAVTGDSRGLLQGNVTCDVTCHGGHPALVHTTEIHIICSVPTCTVICAVTRCIYCRVTHRSAQCKGTAKGTTVVPCFLFDFSFRSQ